ncbi:RNA polymerase subunit sigma-70 [Solirubrobacter phytolaccae]|uniref:RNA polymerase sigma factor n=1 Tax=Solirubrobacter phytolaccae TaxID=1404360 RepID=A0A9X3SHM3_9ACTN|nr:RNA polymerase subunit sigma-70 [Solirubrobacter phytolaccae]MDA0183272.1 RNA polymerase subunit sigma-70 [Solirubrobacter phytolaccae]
MTVAELNDETAFAGVVDRHRGELQVHCYRMLGSYEEAEDLTQETFLRAWRRRETYAERASLRAWLYRIATNACLDALEKRPKTPTANGEITWLQPYPEEQLEAVAAADEDVFGRETIELAFLVAIQHLAPRPRAVLLLRDVLGWRAKDTAELLETTTAGVNSALQRARAVLKEHLPPERGDWTAAGSSSERELLERYIALTESGDALGIKALMHEDARFAMPPDEGTYFGRDTIVDAWLSGGFGAPDFGDFKCVTTRANGQPAVVNYIRKPGAEVFELGALDVLRIEGGVITDITAFYGPALKPFGLPNTLAV